ncbi:hypothetical protein LCGC14_0985840 [marine sediment metagenome]|uniref:Cytosol aminopeptidase domain-containing protein n=1 Tax=marine sediment metagenome TaxID=412755 RepID=A0A0F9NBR6_9ZZZZ
MHLFDLKNNKLPQVTIKDYSTFTDDYDALENVVIFVDSDEALETIPFDVLINHRLQAAIEAGLFSWKEDEVFHTTLRNDIGTKVSVAKVDDPTKFEVLTLAGDIADEHSGRSIAIYPHDMGAANAYGVTEAMIAAIVAKDFEMPKYTSESPKPKAKIEDIIVVVIKWNDPSKDGCAPGDHIFNPPDYKCICGKTMDQVSKEWHSWCSTESFDRTLAEAKGNNIARYLTAMPTNKLTPGIYNTFLHDLAAHYGWEIEVFGKQRLKSLNAGAFLSVTRASSNDEACIVHLTYKPKFYVPPIKTLSLVGKGICFDTGGLQIKDSEGMRHMNGDMGGSATAVGVMVAVTEQRLQFKIDCWLALAENDIGPDSPKPGDVVTAANGKTIELVDLDAEGRMVLADTMYFASKNNPNLMITMATLTGSMVGALDETYSGAITNKPALVDMIINAGRLSGERVWPFPFDKDYDEHIESDIADLKQCSDDDNADHIIAARFLSNFLDTECSWVHLDLSSIEREDGLGHIPTFNTGFGVRFTLKFLELKWGVL